MGRHDRLHDPLRLAAQRLFASRGFALVSVRDIARSADCSEAALYRHWPGKGALITDLVRTAWDAAQTVLEPTPGDPEHPAVALAQALLRLHNLDPDAFQILFRLERPANGGNPARPGPDLDDPCVMIKDRFRRSLPDPGSPGAMLMASAILGAVLGFIVGINETLSPGDVGGHDSLPASLSDLIRRLVIGTRAP